MSACCWRKSRPRGGASAPRPPSPRSFATMSAKAAACWSAPATSPNSLSSAAACSHCAKERSSREWRVANSTRSGCAPRSAADMKPSWNIAGQIPLITLVLLCCLTALMTSRFLSQLNLTNILVQSSIMAVIAMGMTFVIVGGGFDLSVGSTAALAGCVAAMVMLEAGIAAGVAAGIAAGAAVGLANGLVIAFLNVNPFITTLGTMVLVRGIVFLITGGAPVSGDTGLPGAFVAFGSDRLLGIHYLVWVPALLLAALTFVMHATPYGRRVYATGGSREAAYLSGVPVRRVIASTYVWGGALAGVAGVMLAARLQSGQPTAGEFYELTAIAAVVLGGAALHGGEGTLYKSIIGVFIMIVLGNSLNLLNVDSYWQRVAIGAIIIAAAAADRLRSRQR